MPLVLLGHEDRLHHAVLWPICVRPPTAAELVSQPRDVWLSTLDRRQRAWTPCFADWINKTSDWTAATLERLPGTTAGVAWRLQRSACSCQRQNPAAGKADAGRGAVSVPRSPGAAAPGRSFAARGLATGLPQRCCNTDCVAMNTTWGDTITNVSQTRRQVKRCRPPFLTARLICE
jgi:hypothetical protein